jgi:rhodanese-related sulfurtransferase
MNLLSRLFHPAPPVGFEFIQPKEYQKRFIQGKEQHLLLDVRTSEEFQSGKIAGAKNIDLQSMQLRLAELPKDRPIVIYCRSGNRSRTAAELLARAGFTQIYDLGGLMQWRMAGLPLK